MENEKKIKFEEGLKDLEKIVTELESGDLTLEEVLKRYEEGVRLSRILSEKLQEASKKIETLTKNLEGELETKAFKSDEGEKKSAKKRPSDD